MAKSYDFGVGAAMWSPSSHQNVWITVYFTAEIWLIFLAQLRPCYLEEYTYFF